MAIFFNKKRRFFKLQCYLLFLALPFKVIFSHPLGLTVGIVSKDVESLSNQTSWSFRSSRLVELSASEFIVLSVVQERYWWYLECEICPGQSAFSDLVSRSVLEGRTKVVMSRKGKARIGKGLGFNLCVAPRPTLSPYFGSGRLRSERRSTKTEAENFGGT